MFFSFNVFDDDTCVFGVCASAGVGEILTDPSVIKSGEKG